MIEFLPLVLTGLGLTASIVYYSTVIRNQNKTRQNAILYQRFNTSLEYQTILMEILEQHDWKNLDDVLNLNISEKSKLYLILNHYHALGLLLKEKATNSELLLSLYGPPSILTICRKYETIVNEMREHSKDSRTFEGIDYLRDEVLKRYPEINLIKGAKL